MVFGLFFFQRGSLQGFLILHTFFGGMEQSHEDALRMAMVHVVLVFRFLIHGYQLPVYAKIER